MKSFSFSFWITTCMILAPLPADCERDGGMNVADARPDPDELELSDKALDKQLAAMNEHWIKNERRSDGSLNTNTLWKDPIDDIDNKMAMLRGFFEDDGKEPVSKMLNDVQEVEMDTRKAAKQWARGSEKALMSAHRVLMQSTNQAQLVLMKDGAETNRAINGHITPEFNKLKTVENLSPEMRDRIRAEHENTGKPAAKQTRTGEDLLHERVQFMIKKAQWEGTGIVTGCKFGDRPCKAGDSPPDGDRYGFYGFSYSVKEDDGPDGEKGAVHENIKQNMLRSLASLKKKTYRHLDRIHKEGHGYDYDPAWDMEILEMKRKVINDQ